MIEFIVVPLTFLVCYEPPPRPGVREGATKCASVMTLEATPQRYRGPDYACYHRVGDNEPVPEPCPWEDGND